MGFQAAWVKVKVTVAIFRQNVMALVPTFIDGPILLHMFGIIILSKFDFQGARIKVKVVVAIFRKKTLPCSSAYIYQWILI